MPRPARILNALAVFAAVAAIGATASTLTAQAAPPRRTNNPPPRAYGDINFAGSQPLGAFNDFIGEGFGVTGGFVWNLDRDRVFGIRAEGGFVQYGNEQTDACLINCRIEVAVNTSNEALHHRVLELTDEPRDSPYRTGPRANTPGGLFRDPRAYFAVVRALGSSAGLT